MEKAIDWTEVGEKWNAHDEEWREGVARAIRRAVVERNCSGLLCLHCPLSRRFSLELECSGKTTAWRFAALADFVARLDGSEKYASPARTLSHNLQVIGRALRGDGPRPTRESKLAKIDG